MHEVMQEGTFLFNDQHSEEIGCYIRERRKKIKGKRIVEMKEVHGKNKLVPIDKGYYTNSTLSLSCFCLVPSYDDLYFIENEVSAFLDTAGEYVSFTPFYDPHYIYEVINNNEISFEGTRGSKLAVPFSFELSVAPFKYRKTGLDPQTFFEAFELENPEKYYSEPYMKIYGYGDITVYVNGVPFVLTAVDQFIEIDSDSDILEVYKESDGVITNQNHKMVSADFPFFSPGWNVVEWKGNVEKIELKGRWRARA
ncbi:phage tail protein [Enterococcus sp. BWR-S5]|uniref:phage tail protein n=1 Tax=Enterococcus sp. BWR-S5 TaxID=2787714 RepID=UPI001922296F|nr:phage tail protein [Enterococcus sp. BWR-S5]MBL1226610.1 phage tail protein [Enterococcus sp. BWR-S5]